MHPLTTLLGIDCPIIQAPMAGTATPALAAAVSNAGALGSISIAATDAEGGRAMLGQLHGATAAPFNVNVFCHVPARPDAAIEAAWLDHLAPFFRAFEVEPPAALHDIYTSFSDGDGQLRVLLERPPKVVSFHLGLPPAGHIDALKRAGVTLLASATNLDEALQVQAAGIDIVVAQGDEAGGHRGIFDTGAADPHLSTAALLRLLAGRLAIPVVAAGGIMDGHDIAAAVAAGALAAQLGTAFVLCPESSANAAYRAMLASARARHTALTTVISGRPARGIVNRFLREVGAPGHPPVPAFGIAYDGGKQLIAAAAGAGNHEFAAHWAGGGAARARAMPAAQLVALLRTECGL